jgi:PPP family 3-phenylpropionic acid transporter
LGVFIVRVLLYSVIKSPWLVLPVQLLHGPAFSGMWIAGVSYAREIAPEGMGGTAQGLFSGVLLGLGGTLGAFLGGFFYDRIGAAWLFRLVAAGIVLALLLFAVLSKKTFGSDPFCSKI